MAIKGAGGTQGGIGSFFLGLAMMVGGAYLFLTSIQVVNRFHFGYSLFRLGAMPVTSGMVMIPFVFGIGIIFYNAKNLLGWFLAVGSLIMLGVGVISSINFRLRSMSAFELIIILVLMIGGLGLFLRSLKNFGTS